MNFVTIQFAIFLPIVFIIYWLIPDRFRWFFLLLASYYFYMSWNPKYVFLIFTTTVLSYLAARLIGNQRFEKFKKWILVVLIVSCLGILFFFKYFNFISENVTAFLNLFALDLHPVTLNVLLPVGISFYTFQSMSYVIDVYNGKVQPEKHFGEYATFISFFPQLVAGPIERTGNLLPQIKKKKKFNYNQAVDGMKLMTWGVYKKVVIADVVAVYVDRVYTDVYKYSGFDLAAVIFFFTIQIYCDFSGYSDIAIGTAKLLGINLMKNFDSPYFADSIKDFWNRWHISLSTWLKDYIYIPLGGNRCSKGRNNINLFITFVASGLWHGANWTYVCWGAIHGIALIVEKSLDKYLKPIRDSKIGRVISVLVVFAFCNLAWVFFRADSIGDAIYVITHFLSGINHPSQYLSTNMRLYPQNSLKIICTIVILIIYDFFARKVDLLGEVSKKPLVVRWTLYIVMLLMIMCFRSSGNAEFVYFQF